jgi:hypothetical protein
MGQKIPLYADDNVHGEKVHTKEKRGNILHSSKEVGMEVNTEETSKARDWNR